MAFQARFRKAYANFRKNPFTGADLSQAKTENGIVIPSSSPYFVQLVEVPRKDSPSSVSVFNVTENVQMTEVSTTPGHNQFRVDYLPPDGQGTGIIEFSSVDAGKTVNISYIGTGSPIVTEFLDTFMSHPLNEASGDMYYYDGEVQRVGNAINVTTKKLTSTVLNPVNLNSTDTTQDKVISNAQGKNWEDHRNSKHEFATPIGTIVAWLGGYFTNSSNGGYTAVLGGANSIAAANSYLNPLGWYVCNGTALNDSASPIFNGAGRYLPNLTDSRFIQGSNTGGAVGGANSVEHSHNVGSYQISSVTDHTHTIQYSSVNTGTQSVDHTHEIPANHGHEYMETECLPNCGSSSIGTTGGVTGGGTTTSGVSADHSHSYDKANTPTAAAGGHTHNITGTSATATLDNRPQFLTCFYIMRVK